MPPGSARSALDSLAVKRPGTKDGYARDRFGSAWADTDGNGCGTRDDILKRDLRGTAFRDAKKCVVVSGTLPKDPYTGKSLRYQRGRSTVDIDHVVALSGAWRTGARQWPARKRVALANDPPPLPQGHGRCPLCRAGGNPTEAPARFTAK
ncbi:HNH endonuclease family protein [Streptomyces sp. NPDC020883]|uniref:HNH endonuclease family protein n=1 Tax=Streptomyces sp. NPDC020883 TaxID=3365099 RepID=UPI00379CEAF8